MSRYLRVMRLEERGPQSVTLRFAEYAGSTAFAVAQSDQSDFASIDAARPRQRCFRYHRLHHTAGIIRPRRTIFVKLSVTNFPTFQRRRMPSFFFL